MPRPTLLLLHGALGSPATLAPLAARLADDFTVQSLAFAGHGGRAVQAATFGLAHFGAEVGAFLAAHETAPAHVFGYSMGGYAALLAARQQPARFASITTLGTKLDWSIEAAAAETRFLDPEKMLVKVPAFAQELQRRHAPADWAEVVRATAALMRAAGAAPLLTEAALAAVPVPVQVLVGEADPTAHTPAGAALAACLPRGRYEVLPATPHPLERVDLAMLSAKIRAFAQSAQG